MGSFLLSQLFSGHWEKSGAWKPLIKYVNSREWGCSLEAATWTSYSRLTLNVGLGMLGARTLAAP